MHAKNSRSMKQRFIIKNFWLFFCSFTIPTLLVGALLAGASFQSTSRQVEARIDNSLALALDSVEQLTQESRTLIYYFENSNQLIRLYNLLGNEGIDYTASVALRYFNPLINAITYARLSLDSLYLYMPNQHGRVFTSSSSVTTLQSMWDKEWEEELGCLEGGGIVVRYREIRQYDFEEIYEVISVFHRFQQFQGGIVVNYKRNYLTDQMDAVLLQDGQGLFVVNTQGEILFGSGDLSSDIVRQLLDEEANLSSATVALESGRYRVRTVDYEPLGLRIVTYIPTAAIYRDVMRSMMSTLLLLLFITASTILMALYMAAKNFRQLAGIIDIFDRAQAGQPLPPVETGQEDLFSFILNNVTRTFVESSYLRVQLSQRKYKLRVAELMALQYQINPHFLFNTLQTLNYEVLALTKGESTQANRMLEELSDILRYSLESPDTPVSLETEIAHCKKYVFIQSIRYDSSFQVDWDVDECLLGHPVPRLILQPLLENGIQHGIKPGPGQRPDRRMKICIHSRGDSVRFRIIDNGAGISPRRLEEVRRMLENHSESRAPLSEHIGLGNCSQRLVLHYFPGSRIYIRSRQDRGTAVWFSIPFYSN